MWDITTDFTKNKVSIKMQKKIVSRDVITQLKQITETKTAKT